MPARSVVEFTTGAARSGKTYSRCARWLIEEHLPRREGRHISNYPIMFEPWIDVYGVKQPGLIAVAKARLGIDEEEVRERVLVIPPAEMLKWQNLRWNGSGRPYGPWFTFQGVDLSGCHISIDECHNYIPRKAPKALVQEWEAWLGELGHEGCTVEFLSQSERKVNECIHNAAELRYELLNNDRRRDPLFGILNYYWRQLAAKLGWKYPQTFWQIEYRQVRGKWKAQEPQRYFRADRELYGVYNSNSQSIRGGKAGAFATEESKLYTWPQFIAWFVLDNFMQLAWRVPIMLGILSLPWTYDKAIPYVLETAISAGTAQMRDAAGGKKKKGADAAAAAEVPLKPGDQVRAELQKMGVVAPLVDDEDAKRLLAMAKRVEQLADDLETEQVLREIDRKRIVELERQREDASALMAISGESVVLRTGERYRVGERIDQGAYEGETIKGLNHERRTASLASGRVLRLGSGGGVSEKKGIINAVAASVRGPLPGVGRDGGDGEGRQTAPAPVSRLPNGPDADDRVLPDAGDGYGRVDRR